MPPDNAEVWSIVSQAQRDAMVAILDGLVGTPLERSGDITLIVGDTRYVISGQDGSHVLASVVRPGAVEIVPSDRPYRSAMVKAVAARSLEAARGQALGQEFTLRYLARDEWDNLSPVEQRNAGKYFRKLLKGDPLGELLQEKTSDNEWHYTRR